MSILLLKGTTVVCTIVFGIHDAIKVIYPAHMTLNSAYFLLALPATSRVLKKEGTLYLKVVKSTRK